MACYNDDTFDFGNEDDANAAGRISIPVLCRWKLLRPLGGGGMSTAWLARDLRLGRNVVVKLIREDRRQSATVVRQARREHRLLARLDHANIVTLLDGRTCPNHGPFVVLQRVRGENLRDWLRKNDGVALMGLRSAVKVFLQIARALHHVHSRGVLHSDVKPGNILVTRRLKAVLIDFGASKRLRGPRARVRPHSYFGTPGYESPEQLRGRLRLNARGIPTNVHPLPNEPEQMRRPYLDARSDLYSLGATMFTVLAGNNPFIGTPGENDPAQRCVPPLEFLRPDVPPELSQLVARLLEQDRRKRPASAAVVAGELRKILVRLPKDE
jgi:serine/threonine protein kinase